MSDPVPIAIEGKRPSAHEEAERCAPAVVEAALLTGGGDRSYAVGLAMGLMAKGVRLDFIGGDEVDGPELRAAPSITYFHLRRNGRKDAGYVEKAWRVLAYYARLIGYAATAKPSVFHILWNNKFEHFDRTVLMLYYKVLGKRIVLTAHNVNAAARDQTDSWLNRLTLRIQYRLCDHIFVHTEQMQSELVQAFRVPKEVVSVVRFGINEAVPKTALTPAEAKRRLGIAGNERTILFFGNIAAYKGLEHLIEAFERLVSEGKPYRLIVAGRAKKPSDPYVVGVRESLARDSIRERCIVRMEFIPDDEVELYFKAADVAVLPYTRIFQSGVMFLAYSFGLPVIATAVGSLGEDVVEGETGFTCEPEDSLALAKAIERYFASPLYRELDSRRGHILEYVRERHSWEAVGERTRSIYLEAMRR